MFRIIVTSWNLEDSFQVYLAGLPIRELDSKLVAVDTRDRRGLGHRALAHSSSSRPARPVIAHQNFVPDFDLLSIASAVREVGPSHRLLSFRVQDTMPYLLVTLKDGPRTLRHRLEFAYYLAVQLALQRTSH